MTEQQHTEPVFHDFKFRQKRKQGQYREVEAPRLEAPVADTHTHLQLLPDPALALARCAAHKVEFLCTIVDVVEGGPTTYNLLNDWRYQAAEKVRRLVSWC